MGKHSLVKHANPGPERTKGDGSYEKIRRTAAMEEGSCDRNCHLGEKNIATAKLLLTREGCEGINFLTSPSPPPPSPASAKH